MRLHVPALPHTLPTADYVHCAYTEKIRKLSRMMRSLGHEVFVYESDEPWPPDQNIAFPFDVNYPVWQRQNARAIEAIKANHEPNDLLCLIGGLCQQPIAAEFPSMPAIEFGIGYYGVFAPFQVFESYAHQAHVYGRQGIMNGRFFDAVIPNYYEPADFPFSAEKDDYLLFIARLNWDKGIGIASDVAQRLGKRLVVCGQGTPPTGAHIDFRGRVGVEERGQLMARAQALILPTLYLEPFGGVAVEAQLCGTPVITTDWGAFPETVEQGVTGFRCHYMGEFLDAAQRACELDPATIRKRSVARYSVSVIRHEYDRYFQRIARVLGDGFYDVTV